MRNIIHIIIIFFITTISSYQSFAQRQGGANLDSNIKGNNVGMAIEKSAQSEFKWTQIGDKTWKCTNTTAQKDQGTFTEIGRDEWSVYITNTSTGRKFQIDLWQKKVYDKSTGLETFGDILQVGLRPETTSVPQTNPIPSAGWAAFNPGSSYFFITNIGNKKVFDVAASGTQVGTNVGIWGKHGGNNQKFKFVSKGNGYYAIETALKKDTYLSVHHSGKADNTNIKLNNPVGQQQHFKIEKNAKGEVRFISKLGSDLYLGTDDNGSNLALRKGEKGNKTLFNLIPINANPPNNITTPVVIPPSNNNGTLTTFSAYDKDGKAVLKYKYKKKEDENNFSTECSLPEWLPEYDFTTTSKKYLDIFYPACAKHDRNYRAPWRIAGFQAYTGREIADESWYQDMITICEDRYEDSFAERQYCKTVAKSWLTAVHKSPQGKEAFDNGQKYADKYYDQNSIKTGGIIYVNSSGSYIAYMKVNYILNGKRVKKERTLEPGTSDEISIPLGASDINLHVYGTVHAEDLDFKKNYHSPVKKCFEISGKYSWSGYDASWKNTSCD